MSEFTFDIFRGIIGKDEIWLEAVSGLEDARQRMHQIAAADPGLYFVFNSHSHSIVACADTRSPATSFFEQKRRTA